MKLRALLLGLAALVALLLVGLAVFVATFDAERYRPEIVAAAKHATGRELTLGGKLALELFPLRVEAQDVSFANAPWGSRPKMATIERLALELGRRALVFERRLEVRSVELSGVDLLLERSADGIGNWALAPEAIQAPGAPEPPVALPDEAPAETPAAATGALPAIESITLDAIAVAWRDGKTGAETRAQIDHFALARVGDRTNLDLAGRFHETDLMLSGVTGRLRALDGSAGRWPIDLSAQAAGAEVTLKGTIDAPRALQGVDLRIDAHGKSLADLSRLTGVALPGSKSWSLGGRVTHGSDTVWSVQDLAAAIGRSSLSGNATLTTGGDRPKLTATLTATRLATEDVLAAAWGEPSAPAPPSDAQAPSSDGAAPPGTGPGGPPAVSARGARLFSDAPLPYAALARADADVSLQIAQLRVAGATLTDVASTALLEDGALDLSLAKATLAGGSVTGDLDLIASKQDLAAKLQATGVSLGTLAGELGLSQILRDGGTGLDVDVAGRGASLRQVMGSLDGRGVIDMGAATLAASADELARSQLARALLRGLVGGEQTRIACLVGRFDVSDGIARTRVLFAQSDRLEALGDGAIDLGHEIIELYVIPRRGVVSQGVNLELAVPLRVSGHLAAPNVAPSPIGTLQGTVGSAVPSLLKERGSPLALLLGDAGSTPSLDCAQARSIAAGQQPPWSRSSLRDTMSPLEKPFQSLKETLKDLFR